MIPPDYLQIIIDDSASFDFLAPPQMDQISTWRVA